MAINELFITDRISITRNISPSYISDTTGKTVKGQFELIEMDMCVREQGFEANNTQKGIINSDQLILYTDNELLTDRSRNLIADCISFNGCDYKIIKVIDNSKTYLPHYKSIAEKIEAYT